MDNISNATVAMQAFGTLICFGGFIVFLIAMFGRIHIRPMIVGLASYFLMIYLLEDRILAALLGEGGPFYSSAVAYMLIFAALAAVMEAGTQFFVFRSVLGPRETGADTAISFAIGFCIMRIIMGGLVCLNDYALSTSLNKEGFDVLMAGAGDQADALRDRLTLIAAMNPTEYLFQGFAVIAYCAKQIALAVLVWFAAVRSDSMRLLPIAAAMNFAACLPEGYYSGGGFSSMKLEQLMTYALVVLICVFSSRQRQRIEPAPVRFKIDTLRPRRRR